MVEHVVIFKWKEGTDPAKVEEIMQDLRGLTEKVPNILGLSIGQNFTNRSKGFQTGLVVRFPDKAALEVYGPHPEHQKIVQGKVLPNLEELIALDYEF